MKRMFVLTARSKDLRAPLILAIALTGSRVVIPLEILNGASAADQVSAVTDKASEAVQDAGQAVQSKLDQFSQRIEEKRLKNRTPDQIAAWVIMGLLVGGLIYRFSKLNWFVTLLVGLAGAFVGGIAENVIHFNLGLGPVLISYEELLASFAGGVIFVVLGRWVASRRAPKK